MTDVNLKQMMYEENMRQIEDELVPFGEVDDGVGDGTEMIDGERWTVHDSTELY